MKNKNYFFLFIIVCFTLFLLFFSSDSIFAAKEAMKICSASLIPSLFPFFVCSNIIINSGGAEILAKILNPVMRPIFSINGECSLAIVMGLISGYPVGAKTASDLYITGKCSKSDCEKVLAFCNNSGPMFILGALGSNILGSPSAGRLLYFSHVLSSLSVALIMRHIPSTYTYTKREASKRSFSGIGEIFSEAVSSSAMLMLTVCGYVILFSILVSFVEKLKVIDALESFGLNYTLCKSLIYGFFECSGGCMSASFVGNELLKYLIISAILAWSGISVHLQVLGILKKAKLSPRLYFKGKALMTIISPVITFILYDFSYNKIKLLLLAIAILFLIYKLFLSLKHTYLKHPAFPPR